MRCRYSDNDVALYVEGDLPAARAFEFQTHTMTCAQCREIEDGLRESQATLKSLRQDTVSAAALSSVRANVLAEIGAKRGQWGWSRWVYGFAGGGLAVLFGAGIVAQLPKPSPEVQQTASVAPLPPVPPVPLMNETATSPVAPKQSATREARASRRPAAREQDHEPAVPAVAGNDIPADAPKPLVVKLLTDDPNIVIYWLVDQKDGGT